MKNVDEVLDCIKKADFTKNCPCKCKQEEKSNIIIIILAIIGAVAAVAGIAYAVYRYMTPDYLDDFDDDFDEDEYDDDFFEDDEESYDE